MQKGFILFRLCANIYYKFSKGGGVMTLPRLSDVRIISALLALIGVVLGQYFSTLGLLFLSVMMIILASVIVIRNNFPDQAEGGLCIFLDSWGSVICLLLPAWISWLFA